MQGSPQMGYSITPPVFQMLFQHLAIHVEPGGNNSCAACISRPYTGCSALSPLSSDLAANSVMPEC